VRAYSIRERVLFAVGLLICGAASAGIVMLMITQRGAVSDPWLWVAGLGTLSGSYMCLKIFITGRATPYLEQDIRDVFGFRDKGQFR
jgi:hypothetical protein